MMPQDQQPYSWTTPGLSYDDSNGQSEQYVPPSQYLGSSYYDWQRDGRRASNPEDIMMSYSHAESGPVVASTRTADPSRYHDMVRPRGYYYGTAPPPASGAPSAQWDPSHGWDYRHGSY